ncbi:MAG: type IV pilus secretin PilQ [Myxococcota bacterium]
MRNCFNATMTLTALVATASTAFAAEVTTIQGVETRKVDSGREVVIHTSKAAPTFSVFRLTEPFRILVDVSGGQAAPGLDAAKASDEVIKSVTARSFTDELSSIARVEITLDSAAEFSAKAEGKNIVVRITGQKAHKDAPATAPAAPAVEAPTFGKLDKKTQGQKLLLVVPFSGPSPASENVAIQELQDPPRIVVDIAGAKVEPKWQKLAVATRGVERARVGTQDDGVRFVLDLKAGMPLPEVNVESDHGRMSIVVAPAAPVAPNVAKAEVKVEEPVKAEAPKVVEIAKVEPVVAPKAEPVVAPKAEPVVAKAEPVVAKAEPVAPKAEPVVAPKAEPVVAKAEPVVAPKAEAKLAKAEPKAAKLARVQDVRFEPKDGFLRLSLELTEDFNVGKDDASTKELPMLRVKGTKLPESLVRTLDTTAVGGSTVRAISTYTDGDDTIIAANIGGETEHRQWRKGNTLYWDFRKKGGVSEQIAVTETTQRVEFPRETTAGYEAQAAAQQVGNVISAQARARYTGKRISLDLKDAEIQNVLRLLADVSQLNIVAGDDVKGKVTLKLKNVPWDQALDIILASRSLDKTRSGNIIRVAPIDVLEKEAQLRAQREEASQKLEPLSVRLVPIAYAVAKEIKPQVEALLSSRGKVNIDTRTNVLIVEDVEAVLVKVERLVRKLDTQTPQVLIEARIVQAKTDFTREMGIQWGPTFNFGPNFNNDTGLSFPNSIQVGGAQLGGTSAAPSGGLADAPLYAVNFPVSANSGLAFTFGSLNGAALLHLRLTAEEKTGKTKIISAPRIVTIDNKPAKILSGEKIPITVVTANGPSTRFIDANLEMEVTPHVTTDGSILINIQAKQNQLSDRVDSFGVPGIIVREAETEMLVADGDTAVLGGIYKRTAIENKSYTPFFGEIPVLGWLFKSSHREDSRDELLIFISPRLVNRSEALVESGASN